MCDRHVERIDALSAALDAACELLTQSIHDTTPPVFDTREEYRAHFLTTTKAAEVSEDD